MKSSADSTCSTSHGPPLGAADQRIARALTDVATSGILQQRTVCRGSILVVHSLVRRALPTTAVLTRAEHADGEPT